MSGGQAYRVQIAADKDMSGFGNDCAPYDQHWSDEYSAMIKAKAKAEWDEIEARYDDLRSPIGGKQ